ncbi:MAG: tetratricopeptide repeat protein [Bryobacterales bacterium]|nr:tetratricopeptide repeat protein [Bryobacterales bacterium]
MPSRTLPCALRAALSASLALCVLAVSARASDPLEQWARQVELANQLLEKGQLEEASAVYLAALTDARAAGDRVRGAVVLHNLGRLLSQRGQLREAASAYQQAMNEFAGAGNAHAKSLVRSAAGLVAIHLQAREYSKAKRLIQRVLASLPDEPCADRLHLISALGVILARQGRLHEAERLFRDAARMSEEFPGPDAREAGAVALANLAGLQMRMARNSEALASYQRALAIMEALPAPSPAALALTLADYGAALAASGDRQTAGELLRTAIATAQSRLGPDHEVLARVLEAQADWLREQGRKSEARKLRDEARRIFAQWARRNATGFTVEVSALAQPGR